MNTKDLMIVVLLKSGQPLEFIAESKEAGQNTIKQMERAVNGTDKWLTVPEGIVSIDHIAAIYLAKNDV